MTPGSEDGPQQWDRETDVLVVGFGGAGACAAIAAHDAGSEVLVVEKQAADSYYSNTRMSGGGFHAPRPSGDPDALEAYSLAMFSGHNLPWKLEGELPEDIAEALAAKWAEYAPENFAWLQEIDSEFDAIEEGGAAFPDFPGAEDADYRVLRSTYHGEIVNRNACQKDFPKERSECGEAFFTCLRTGIEERGIEVEWGQAAEDLVTEEGTVRGITVTDDQGQNRSIGAGAVVLTTGGFEFNEHLRRDFLEGPGVEGWAFYGSPANTGDGITMSMDAGAALSKVSKSASRMIVAIPERRHGLKIGLRTPVVGRPGAIVVDNFGGRYANERKITQDPSRYFFYKEGVKFDIDRLVYPRVPSWLVFDETLRTTRSVVSHRETGYHDIDWGERNEGALSQGWILTAETLPALGAKIRDHPENRSLMDPDDLAGTVRSYNENCDAGEGDPFGSDPANMGPIRKPPYYAVPLYPGGPNTKGGILTNAEREVLDRNSEPIGNLYSAGEISSAFKFVYQGGGNLAECIVFGRIAGENAAGCAT